jgi:hypothetical protein
VVRLLSLRHRGRSSSASSSFRMRTLTRPPFFLSEPTSSALRPAQSAPRSSATMATASAARPR